MTRYDRARKYACTHVGCEREALLLSHGCPGRNRAHNCCGPDRHKQDMYAALLDDDPYAWERGEISDEEYTHLASQPTETREEQETCRCGAPATGHIDYRAGRMPHCDQHEDIVRRILDGAAILAREIAKEQGNP